MEGPKKISFGFNKTTKRANLNRNNENEKSGTTIELVRCVEGKKIKLLNFSKEENENTKPLIIPMKDKACTSAALASLKLRQQVLTGTKQDAETKVVEQCDSTENTDDSIEKRAARELLKQAKGEDVAKENIADKIVPIKPDEMPLEGAQEPTIKDYGSMPISQFGLAMLRGMGWKEDSEKKTQDIEGPVLRPKGMGLGADKVIKPCPLLIPPEVNEKLEIKKKAYVRILGGKNKGLYGQIEGLDEHAGRVVLKLALGGEKESLNEFMVQPVSRREYAEYAKVINSTEYEQYKKSQDDHNQDVVKREKGKDDKRSVRGGTPLIKCSHKDSGKDKTERSVKQSLREIGKDERQSSTPKSAGKYASHSKDYSTVENKRRDTSSRSSTSSYSKERRSRRKSSTRDRDKGSHKRDRTRSRSDSTDSSHHHAKKKKKLKKDKHKYRSRRDNSSSDGDKRHKKKTKRSKRPRSRSRARR